MIFIAVRWTVRPESADRWMDLVADFTAATRAEPGNLFFEWSRGVDDACTYYLVEAFRDGAAEAHVTSAHFRAACEQLPDHVAATPSIISVSEVPGEGWGEMAEIQPRA